MSSKLQNPNLTRCVLQAVKQGDARCLHNLLKQGIKADIPGRGDWLPLHEAAFFKQPTSIRVILAHDSSKVNHQAFEGETALIIACEQGCSESVKVLLQNGANPNLKSRGGQNPLIAAVDSEHGPEMLPLLLAHGADVNLDDDINWNAVYSAVEIEDTTSFQLLLKAGLHSSKFLDPDPTGSINKYWIRLLKAAKEDIAIELLLLLFMYLDLNDWLRLANNANRILPTKHRFHTFDWKPFTSILPHSLLHLCRLAIRKTLLTSTNAPSIYKVNVDQLDLPADMKRLLTFDGSK